MGTVAVTEAMRAAALGRARFLYTSSSFVYGGAERRTSSPFVRTQPLRPLTPYGASKAAGEDDRAAVRAPDGAEEIVIARAFQHTGPGPRRRVRDGRLGAPAGRDRARRRLGRHHCGNIEVERDYLDVRDVASAYRGGSRPTARRARSTTSRATCRARMRSLLEGLIEAFDVDVEIEVDPERLRSVDQQVFLRRLAKARSETGWKPTTRSSDARGPRGFGGRVSRKSWQGNCGKTQRRLAFEDR